MYLRDLFKRHLKEITSLRDHLDTKAAAASIRNNIYFKGPTVWILAFSIVIASVGLNINSTAVIIGAMLISPLMGPIIGLGMGVGINDYELVSDAFRNLIIMVLVSLVVSFLYFLLSPLRLANPTELAARTSPTIYDVIIALFGGMAGILEQCRKEKGTVISGVAIATALMPPLCTAGYGLAHGLWRYFFGAMGLFIINTAFIAFATYVFVKYLHFSEKLYVSEETQKKTEMRITGILLLIIIPSLLSAFFLVKENNFTTAAEIFVTENHEFGNVFLYNHRINDGKLELFLAGEELDEDSYSMILEKAKAYKIKPQKIIIREHHLGENVNDLLEGLSTQFQTLLDQRDERLDALESENKSLKAAVDSLKKAAAAASFEDNAKSSNE